MAHTVELIPLTGIVLNGRTVRLGDTKAEAERILGQPLGADGSADPRWFYFGNELRLDFDGRGRVEFIELLGGRPGELQPVIDGVEIFQAEPETVYDLLKAKNSGPIDIGVNCYSCTFLNLETGVYREHVPEDVAEMIGEARAEGRPLTPEEIDYETGLTHWAAIGVGVKGYYT